MSDSDVFDDEHPEEVPTEREPIEHVDGALMVSFGAVVPGRERLASENFVEVSQYFGKLRADGRISDFRLYFFADGQFAETNGFWILQGRRRDLDAIRTDEEFIRLFARGTASNQNVRIENLWAGATAGRIANVYREARREIGLL